MSRLWFRRFGGIAVLAGSLYGCQAGGWRTESGALDALERELRGNGLVTIKRPDVWTENRLHTYRREFEDAFFDPKALRDFKPNLNASASVVQTQRLGMSLAAAIEIERLGAAARQGPGLANYLSLALLKNFDTKDAIGNQDFLKILQQGAEAYVAASTGIDPAALALATEATDAAKGLTASDAERADGEEAPAGDGDPDTDAAGGGGAADGADAPGADGSAAGDAPEGEGPSAKRRQIEWLLDPAKIEDLMKVPAAPDVNLLSPFEVQNQKRAFVQQNHLFRIGNEPDDGTRMNGYTLYYMRFMVSTTPSASTARDHSAEILLTPTYDVRDAARDWVAQYTRGLLRERILRVVELGLERAIATRLRDYGREAPAYQQREIIREIVATTEQLRYVDCDSDTDESLRRLKERFVSSFPAHAALSRAFDRAGAAYQAACKAEREVRQRYTLDPRQGLFDFAKQEVVSTVSDDGDRKTVREVFEQLRNELHVLQASVKGVDLGAGLDTVAAKYASDIGLKLRTEYLGIQRLAQLAYDELSREVDYRLGVPNAVYSYHEPERRDRGRIGRAILALDKILEAPRDDSLLDLRADVSSATEEVTQLDLLIASAVERFVSEVGDARTMSLGNASLDPRSKISGQTPPAYGHLGGTVRIGELFPTWPTALRDAPSQTGRGYSPAAAEAACEMRIEIRKLLAYFSQESWPIYTYAVAPFSEAENIARAVDLNNELQVLIDASLKAAKLADVQVALDYARATREQFRALQVNRTVVGVVRGENSFGWQINPPYSVPVRRSQFSGGYVNDSGGRMPSQTHEVFALVAVPGFLRSLDFGVHYDWTGQQRADAVVIGTGKAAEYLRRFRRIDNNLSFRRDADPDNLIDMLASIQFEGPNTSYEDNLWLAEHLRQRLALVESSLPLRLMRKVFLPYADVSERMTNTSGIGNLLPQITRVVPRYLPSHHEIVVTIEGRNFDTGRIEVIVGGRPAAKVQVLNDRTLVATLPARELMGDLTVSRRTGDDFDGARTSTAGKQLQDLEGLVDVLVITPTGMASEVAVIRLTKEEAAAAGGGLKGTLTGDAAIAVNVLFEPSAFGFTLSEAIPASRGMLRVQHKAKNGDLLEATLEVLIAGDKVTLAGLSPDQVTSLKKIQAETKEVAGARLYPFGGFPDGIAISGSVKLQDFTAVQRTASATIKDPAKGVIEPDKLIFRLSHPFRADKARVTVQSAALLNDLAEGVTAEPSGAQRTITITFDEAARKRLAEKVSPGGSTTFRLLTELSFGGVSADLIPLELTLKRE